MAKDGKGWTGIFTRWIPWGRILRYLAEKHGFIDPIALVGRLQQFAQPSEVAEPMELLRAGAMFHGRGLLNRKAIESNLDWVWPHWIVRQFDPHDPAFVPRAFSVTHINLTHRNWTAVGVPNCHALPIVDPRGLLTPLYDKWSIDAWVVPDEGEALLPSQEDSVEQRLDISGDPIAVHTQSQRQGLRLSNTASVEMDGNAPVCRLRLKATADRPAWLVLSLRPFNPEGISLVNKIQLLDTKTGWIVDDDCQVTFSEAVERHRVSNYTQGDVFTELPADDKAEEIECRVGMATAAALFRIEANAERELQLNVPLRYDKESTSLFPSAPAADWQSALEGSARLQIPDPTMQFLYDAAVHNLILFTPGDTYPGPYTYKRFWFRDAALITNGLLHVNLPHLAERVLSRFPDRLGLDGYFHSQEGEWDSNGQVLWILQRYHELTGKMPDDEFQSAVQRGAKWLVRKRLDAPGKLHDGLLPPGFSAEHLGNNDYYYWDDFWAWAGLLAAAELMQNWQNKQAADDFRKEADVFGRAIERSLEESRSIRKTDAIPASPYRRMDAGAIGSLAGSFPLQLLPPDDPRMLATVDYLQGESWVHDAFFQNMIHSGVNAYLTLHVAQVLLRAGKPGFQAAIQAVVNLASPTGQWPEAIHPRTGGGCMGDGQHIWAAAEYATMIRNLFLRAEGDDLILGSGLFPAWLQQKNELHFGPAPSRFGSVDLHIQPTDKQVTVAWDAQWRTPPNALQICLPGYEPKTVEPKIKGEVEIS